MKLLLFDIDGTLLYGGRAGRRSIGYAFEEIFKIEAAEDCMKQVPFNGRTDPIIIRDIARVAGIDEAHLDEKLEALYDCYLGHLRRITSAPHGASLCPGFPELLDALEKEPGVMLGLLTGNIEAGARTKLEPFNLNRYFSAGGFGSDSGHRPTIAAIARQKFEVLVGHPIASEDVLVIGDTEHDVACGRANGFRTLAVATGGVGIDVLQRAEADLVYENLGDVVGVVDAIRSLLKKQEPL